MEKNGLLHGDFTLPFSKDQAKVQPPVDWKPLTCSLVQMVLSRTAGATALSYSYADVCVSGEGAAVEQ